MLNDALANMFSNIANYEKYGKKELIVHPVSKVIRRIMTILQEHHYVGSFEELTDSRGGAVKLFLLGTVNACGVIKPRFSVQVQEYEKFEKRFLPAKDFGILIISTSKGIMTHEQAKQSRLGGRLLAYCY